MNRTKLVNVYAKDRKTLLAQVSSRCQSVGAAKAAGVSACARTFISRPNGLASGESAWVVK